MKCKTIFICLFSMAWFFIQAQGEKQRIAIFDPVSPGATVDEGMTVAVREIISSVFVNTGRYLIVERSLLEKVMNEQTFSHSGAVDDSQASEIGRIAGASKIVLSVIAKVGNNIMLSIKFVDVNSASVEKQNTRVIGTNQLLDAVEPMTMELIIEVAFDQAIQNQTGRQQVNDEEDAEELKTEEVATEEAVINRPPEQPSNSDKHEEEQIESIPQEEQATALPGVLAPTETKTVNLNVRKGVKDKSTMYYTIGGASLAAGITASILFPRNDDSYGNGTIIKKTTTNPYYLSAGIAIGGFCIIKGIQIKKKGKATPNVSYHDNPFNPPTYYDNHSRLDLIATGYGAGLRLTF